MNFDKFFANLKNRKMDISYDVEYITADHNNYTYNLLDNEALFQMPLICLIVLMMAKDRRKPYVAEIGQMVSESIEASMPAFKSSAQNIGWSANLRVRTVKAMIFLENAGLVEVMSRKGRIDITELGKKVVLSALSRNDNLSINLSAIGRAYRNLCVSKQFDLELI